MEIFSFKDYKNFLRTRTTGSGATRGIQSKLARECSVSRSYISQVLNGAAHFNADQTIGAARVLGLSESETAYFEALVGYARSDSPPSKQRFRKKMMLLRSEIDHKKTQANPGTLDINQIAMGYYSSWEFAVVHMLLNLKKFRDPASIAQHLSLRESNVLEVLSQLETWGLVQKREGKWLPKVLGISIPPNHPMSRIHHRNLRLLSAGLNPTAHPNDLLYSSVFTLSTNELQDLRKLVFGFIQKTQRQARSAVDEKAVCFLLDLFEI